MAKSGQLWLYSTIGHYMACQLPPFYDTDINNKNSVIPENSTACVPAYKLFLCQASGIGIKCFTAQMVMIISSKPLPISFLFHTPFWLVTLIILFFCLFSYFHRTKTGPFLWVPIIQSGSSSDLRLTKVWEVMLKDEKHTKFHSHPATSSRALAIPFTLPSAISVAWPTCLFLWLVSFQKHFPCRKGSQSKLER